MCLGHLQRDGVGVVVAIANEVNGGTDFVACAKSIGELTDIEQGEVALCGRFDEHDTT